mmetsp:Transcript_16996/g.44219  ORF Transcript_16996/g.44219 Transcript_16996/m.44219 type:complete len:449 (-) Transcript_16996:30-1376(-)
MKRRREGTGDAGRRAPPPRAEWGLDPQAWSYLRLTAADVHRLEVHDRNLFVMAGTKRPVVRVEVCGIVVLTETKSHDKVLIYYIDDGTALISCTQFLSNEEGSRKSDTVTYGLGRRVRVRGKLKCVTRGDDYVGGESERSDSGGGVGVGAGGSGDGGVSAMKATVAFELADIAITSISPNDELLHMVTAAHLAQTDYAQPCELAPGYRRAVEIQSLSSQKRAACNCDAEAASAASSSSGAGAGGAWGDGVHYCPCIATKLENDPEMRFRRALLTALERKETACFAGEAGADAGSSTSTTAGTDAGGGGSEGPPMPPMRPPPLCCGHRKPCKRALSAAKKSENRAYWKCGEPTGGCKFFKWCEPQEGDTRAGHKRATHERGAWGLGSTHGYEAAFVHGFEPLELYEFSFEDLKADDELMKVALEVNTARGKTGALNVCIHICTGQVGAR